MVGLAAQLSVAAGARATAAAIPGPSLHCRVASRLPAAVVISGAVLSTTVMTCVKLALVLPHPSSKFHTRVRTYALAHVALATVLSLTTCIVGLADRKSVVSG